MTNVSSSHNTTEGHHRGDVVRLGHALQRLYAERAFATSLGLGEAGFQKDRSIVYPDCCVDSETECPEALCLRGSSVR